MLSRCLVLYICCVVLSLVQSVVTEDNLDCGPNEEIKCLGCPPEDSCYDRNQILCPAVISDCSNECACKEGYIRKTLDTECIPKEECGGPCDTLEEYSECKQCANETCSSITNPVKQSCDDKEACTPGCVCWDGYYRANETSYCQHRCSCPELKDTPYCVSWNAPFLEFSSKQQTHT